MMDRKQLQIYLLLFMTYASLTSLRYSWSYTKTQIHQELQISLTTLGLVDSLYVGFYSSGLLLMGNLIHKVTLKSYILMGLTIASLSFMAFPLYYSITSKPSVLVIAVSMSINGLFQATGWPGLMGIFGKWFKDQKQGLLVAILALSGNVGNIYSSTICNTLQRNGYLWTYNYLAAGLLGLTTAILIFQFMEDREQENNKNSNQNRAQQNQALQQSLLQSKQIVENENRYGIFSLLRYPKVLSYAIGCACLKACVYGLYFWLPTFLSLKGEEIDEQKGYISAMMEYGSIIGAFILGFLVDRYNKRSLLLSPLLLTSSILMCLISFFVREPWEYYVAIFILGITLIGPYNIMSTVITLDLSKSIKEKNSITKISSLIEGISVFVSAGFMIVIPHIPFHLLFYVFASECLIAVIILWSPFYEELTKIESLKYYFTNPNRVGNDGSREIQMMKIELVQKETRQQ